MARRARGPRRTFSGAERVATAARSVEKPCWRNRQEGQAGCGGDDRGGSLLHEGREQAGGEVKHADDVGLDDGPRHGKIDGVGGEVLGPGDPGVVDENVEVRELFLHLAGEGIDRARVFDVESHAAHAGVGGGDLVEESLTAAGDDDLIVASMENLGEGAADTAGTASDDDSVASDSIHGFTAAALTA